MYTKIYKTPNLYIYILYTKIAQTKNLFSNECKEMYVKFLHIYKKCTNCIKLGIL